MSDELIFQYVFVYSTGFLTDVDEALCYASTVSQVTAGESSPSAKQISVCAQYSACS